MSELSVVGPRFIEGPALAVANFKGIYPPLPTFFDAREELDLATYRQHISTHKSLQVVVSSQRGRLSPIAGELRLPEPMPRLSCHLLITKASWIAVHW